MKQKNKPPGHWTSQRSSTILMPTAHLTIRTYWLHHCPAKPSDEDTKHIWYSCCNRTTLMLLHYDLEWTPSGVHLMLLTTQRLTTASCLNMSANNNNPQGSLATSGPTTFYHRDPTFTWPVSPQATLEAHQRSQLAKIVSASVFASPHQCLRGV